MVITSPVSLPADAFEVKGNQPIICRQGLLLVCSSDCGALLSGDWTCAGQLPQQGGGVSPHGMLPGFHADAERAARDQLMLQHVQRQLPPPAYPHVPSYLQRVCPLALLDLALPLNSMFWKLMHVGRVQAATCVNIVGCNGFSTLQAAGDLPACCRQHSAASEQIYQISK